MNISIYYVLITLASIIIALIILNAIKFIASRFYSYKVKQLKSDRYPLTLIILGFILYISLRVGSIDNIVINILNKLTDLSDSKNKIDINTDPNIIIDITFIVSFSFIIIYLTKRIYNRRNLLKIDGHKVPEDELDISEYDSKINEEGVFEDRIKEILKHKYRNNNEEPMFVKDHFSGIFISNFNDGIRNIIVVYSLLENSKNLNNETIKVIFSQQQNLISEIKDPKKANYVEDHYLIYEKGIEYREPTSLKCLSENALLNTVIDFKSYLKEQINNFEIKALPYSTRTINDKPLTLKDTFLPPNLKEQETVIEDIDNYLDSWINEKSKRHLVLLGDYGMGKSSFLKHLSYRIAKEYLKGNQDVRIPVFISLANTSLRHGGLSDKIGTFVSKNLGSYMDAFIFLLRKGKILLILDAFDEMGYIGSINEKQKQLQEIWDYAIPNNKILISGRPSYFPIDSDLVSAFRIKDYETLVPDEYPFFSRIFISEFKSKQIFESIRRYKFDEKQTLDYINFLKDNQHILDLCRRPQLMHIVREMLPILYNKYKKEELNSAELYSEYLDHYIERQLSKKITSYIDRDENKKEFIKTYFKELASEYQLNDVEKLDAKNCTELLESVYPKLKELSTDSKTGLQREILSGFFIEITEDQFKFAHKSFKEFLVALKVKELLEDKKPDHPLITESFWSSEIISFFYELVDTAKYGESDIPLLYRIAKKHNTSTDRIQSSLARWMQRNRVKGIRYHSFIVFVKLNHFIPKTNIDVMLPLVSVFVLSLNVFALFFPKNLLVIFIVLPLSTIYFIVFYYLPSEKRIGTFNLLLKSYYVDYHKKKDLTSFDKKVVSIIDKHLNWEIRQLK